MQSTSVNLVKVEVKYPSGCDSHGYIGVEVLLNDER